MVNANKLKVLFFFLAISVICAGIVFADDPFGGPYTPDEYTVLLMHFDDESSLLKNEAMSCARRLFARRLCAC